MNKPLLIPGAWKEYKKKYNLQIEHRKFQPIEPQLNCTPNGMPAKESCKIQSSYIKNIFEK